MKQLILTIMSTIIVHCGVTYKAAVLEYYPFLEKNAQDTILTNLNDYKYYAAQAKAQNADIFVCPEYGLTSIRALSDVTSYAVEVKKENNVIKELEKIASQNQIYLVVNLIEKTQLGYFNTNLVFDRRGNIILKYRKVNLINEPGLTPGARNQALSFTTDFNVTFGICICFDILWDDPSQEVLVDGSVTDVIFVAASTSVMPFYTSLSVQHGYSLANGVNLLAAGYHFPVFGFGGSGIYLADGRIAESYMSGLPNNKLLVQEVPKLHRTEDKTKCVENDTPVLAVPLRNKNSENIFPHNDFNNKSLYTYQNLNFSSNSSCYEICHNKFCCTFDISVDTLQAFTLGFYRLMIYNGAINFLDHFKGHTRLCILLVCKNDSFESCGSRVNNHIKFTKISVRANVENEEWYYFRPVSLNYYLQPLRDVVYCVDKKRLSVEFRTTKMHKHVAAFGIMKIFVSSASSIYI